MASRCIRMPPMVLLLASAVSGCAGVGVGIGGGTGQGFGVGVSLTPGLLFSKPAPPGAAVEPPPRLVDETAPVLKAL